MGLLQDMEKINGVLVYAYAQDFNALGGSLGSVHASKIVKIQEMALKTGSLLLLL